MMNSSIKILAFVLMGILTNSLFGKAADSIEGLSENIRIKSQFLGYDLQFRVYIPPGYEDQKSMPTIYLTDGQNYIKRGDFPKVLASLIENGEIKPVVAVFIDPRDPDNLKVNRRSQQFFCNLLYVNFVAGELVPFIDKHYKTSVEPKDRVILGLSFGGLNSACFGLLANRVFGGIAMNSPAIHPVPKIVDSYKKQEKFPLKIYLSTGTENDNYSDTSKLYRILKKKGYEIKYQKRFGHKHDWKNWKPLMDDVLLYFFSNEDPKPEEASTGP